MSGSRRCPLGCTCNRHSSQWSPERKLAHQERIQTIEHRSCSSDCTCGRHQPTQDRGERISKAKTGMVCPLGCTCARHNGKIFQGRPDKPTNATRKCPLGCDCVKHNKPQSHKDDRTLHPHYHRWYGMLSRCSNTNDSSYPNYGGRGIKVCDEWADDPFTYFAYLETLESYRPGCTIDRIDNDGNYEPGNIRWSTPAEQINNRRPFKRRPKLRKIGKNAWRIG